jgi:hypothetical protein
LVRQAERLGHPREVDPHPAKRGRVRLLLRFAPTGEPVPGSGARGGRGRRRDPSRARSPRPGFWERQRRIGPLHMMEASAPTGARATLGPTPAGCCG